MPDCAAFRPVLTGAQPWAATPARPCVRAYPSMPTHTWCARIATRSRTGAGRAKEISPRCLLPIPRSLTSARCSSSCVGSPLARIGSLTRLVLDCASRDFISPSPDRPALVGPPSALLLHARVHLMALGAIQTQLTSWFGGPSKYTNADNENLYSVYSCAASRCFCCSSHGALATQM